MKVLLGLCVAAWALTGISRAAEPVHDFECDTPAGHYSYWSRTLSSKKVTISGTLSIKEKREHAEWIPVASMLLLGKDSDSFGLQILRLNSQKDFLFVGLTKPGNEDAPPFATITGDTSKIPFSMTLAKNGMLTVTAAGKSATTTIKGFTPDKVQLSCSTGDFLFKDVKIK